MKKNTLNILSNNKTFFSLASNATITVSLWRLIILPFKILCSNWQLFFMLAVPMAILSTASSLGFNRGVLCGTNDLTLAIPNCSDNTIDFYGNMIIQLIFLLFFAVKWYQFAIQKTPFTPKSLFLLSGSQIKTFGIMIIFALINLSPLVALIILFLRVPNPIWQRELLFFTSVAWIFLLPLIALRFYSVIAFTLENKKIPSIKIIWNTTAGNMLKLLLSTAVIVFLVLCLFMQYYNGVQMTTDISQKIMAVTEFEYNILILFFTVLLMNYCYTQKELFFNGEENE